MLGFATLHPTYWKATFHLTYFYKELTNKELFSDKLRDELRPQTVELAREK